MKNPWHDRRVLITGASSGLGAALARELAQAGARLALAARRVELIERMASDFEPLGTEVRIHRCDLSQPGSARTLVERAETELGGLDVLILNAGMVVEQLLTDSDEETARGMMETNFWSNYAAMQAVLPGMTRRGEGRICVVTSFCAYAHLPLSSAYSASKAALASLSLVLANELPPGISVTLVYPGIIRTPMFEDVKTNVPVMGRLAWLGIEPETAARSILKATARRKRRLYLTGAAKAVALSMRIAPQWTDMAVKQIYRSLPKHWLDRS